MPFYQKQTDAEGKEIYVEVNLTAEDLTPELVNAHPIVQELKKETIERRKKISELRKQLDEASAAENGQGEGNQPEQKPVVQPQPLDEEKLAAKVIEILQAQQAQALKLKQEQDAAITKLIQENGLSDDVRPIIEASTSPEATAQALAKSGFRFADASGGEGKGTDMVKAAGRGALARLGLLVEGE